jgi:riboflavin synthase
MFTGLVQTICNVKSVAIGLGSRSATLTVDLGQFADQAKIGDSIAVNGVCLTVSKLDGRLISFDLSAETLEKTTLGRLNSASLVNVELAIKATDRLGGHFVQGHIDGVAKIAAIEKNGQFANIKFAATPELLDQMVPKGSVAVDGISLTIASINQNSFSVAIIPQTLERTTLGKAKVGDLVNIETDIIVKTIKKQLERILPQDDKLTVEKLKEMGF